MCPRQDSMAANHRRKISRETETATSSSDVWEAERDFITGICMERVEALLSFNSCSKINSLEANSFVRMTSTHFLCLLISPLSYL